MDEIHFDYFYVYRQKKCNVILHLQQYSRRLNLLLFFYLGPLKCEHDYYNIYPLTCPRSKNGMGSDLAARGPQTTDVILSLSQQHLKLLAVSGFAWLR